MMFPLVRDLAAPAALLRVPVTVTCRVLGFSTQAFYKWLANPVCQRDWDDAHLINAALDLHGDDPEFGYRLLTDELHPSGFEANENRVWRLCSQQRIFSVHSRKRGLNRKPGPPVHDDLLERDFTAETVNSKWLTDITEHPTSEGKLYLCAIKDCASNKIVGYSLDARMTSELAVAALRNAIALRAPDGTIVHSDRGSQGGFNRSSQHLMITEVSDGATSAASRQGASAGDAVAWPADPRQACGARVLAADLQGQEERGRVGRGRRVLAGRVEVVSSRWRNAALESGRADRPLLVVPRA